jgi:hypothetical protein
MLEDWKLIAEHSGIIIRRSVLDVRGWMFFFLVYPVQKTAGRLSD